MPLPNFRMDNRVALITGAGRGIGLAMAQALASAGCAVAIQDIDLDVAKAEADRLTQSGHRAIALGGDITDLTLPASLVAQTLDALGGLHVLINNAAIQKPMNWLELSVEEIERQIRADQISPILLAQLVAPIFKKQKWGRIINLGSIQAKNTVTIMLPYGMSKCAMDGFTRALAKDLAKDGVTVNLIAPGYFNTYRNRDQFQKPEDLVEQAKGFVPIGRAGMPEDCAGMTLLLASDAGAYITGQVLHIDGGMSAR